MKIGINALSARLGGGVVYLKHLVHYLISRPRGHSYVVFCTPWNREKLGLSPQANLDIVECPVYSLVDRFLFEQLRLPRLVDKLGIQVLYAPAEIAPLFGRFPVVLGIQNLNVYTSHLIGCNWLERSRIYSLRLLAYFSAHRAYAVVFMSEWARKFVAPQLRIPNQKQWVVYHGVDLAFMDSSDSRIKIHSLLKKEAKERKIILAVSNLSPHKNYETLVRSISLLPNKLLENILLVIVGKKLEPEYTRLCKLISKLKLEKNIWFAGEVAHKELGPFYRAASLFVHPTRGETFGLPVLEAMAFGVPLICSRAGALPEIADKAALYFDCDDAPGLADLIAEILLNPYSASERISIGLQRAQIFSWEQTAEKMLEIFQASDQFVLRC
jgi:glycosyltransferase involved in cell wall biosynthesis